MHDPLYDRIETDKATKSTPTPTASKEDVLRASMNRAARRVYDREQQAHARAHRKASR